MTGKGFDSVRATLDQKVVDAWAKSVARYRRRIGRYLPFFYVGFAAFGRVHRVQEPAARALRVCLRRRCQRLLVP